MENRATLLAAIVGAGPTVLIAYFLEFRHFSTKIFPRFGPGIGLLAYLGAGLNFLATIFAVTALADHRNMNSMWDRYASLLFMVGLATLFFFSVVTSMIHPLLVRRRGRESPFDDRYGS